MDVEPEPHEYKLNFVADIPSEEEIIYTPALISIGSIQVRDLNEGIQFDFESLPMDSQESIQAYCYELVENDY